jgi:hypothetical protein
MRDYNNDSSFWQWDTGRKLVSNKLKVGDEVDFSSAYHLDALPVLAKEEDGVVVVEVPNILLQVPGVIHAYRTYRDGEGRITREDYSFKVNARKKPVDYIYSETDQKTYEALEKRIEELEQNGGSGLVGPQGPQGIQGETGADGESSYEIAVKNGFEGSEQEWLESLKGEDGKDGQNGQDGSDYVLTEADKQEIAEQAVKLVIMEKAVDEPAEDDIPKVFFGGALPQTKDEQVMSFHYISKTSDFKGYCKTKAQGSSSMSYPKKNQTVKLFKDADCTEKMKVNFNGWGKQDKFCFKANWIDHSHARNIVCANLWNEVVKSRTDYNNLPEEMRNSPCNGAIDGFPVKLYANGTYQGIYTLNIPKDAWMWNMDEENPNHVLLCGETNTDGVYTETACNFRALWSGTSGDNWSIEVGNNSEAVKTSLNALITCVKDTDDDTFKTTIGDHLDVQSAIDYYIHQYVICGLDGLAKNMLLATYDGTKWICGAYDMDSTFLLYWDGSKLVNANYRCPEDYQEQFSLLWGRLEKVFSEELKTRYNELRNSVYSFANMCNHFERFTDSIGAELYAEDVEVYPNIPSADVNNIKQIRNAIRDRLSFVDGEFLNMGSDLLYSLDEHLTLDGTGVLDTDIKPFEKAQDFTIFLDMTCGDQNTTNQEPTLLNVLDRTVFSVVYGGGQYWSVRQNDKAATLEDTDNGNWGHTWASTKRMILVFKDGALTFGKYLKANDSVVRYIKPHAESGYVASTENLIIGGRKRASDGYSDNFWAGTINDFRIYNRALSEDEAVNLMNEAAV